MSNDTGGWLSAEQAVLPDGTLRSNLPLINRKLPALNATPVAAEAQESDDASPQAPADGAA